MKFRLLQQVLKALAIDGNAFTLDDVFDAVSNGHMQAWPGPNSLLITELVCYPSKKMLRVIIAAGDIREILTMIPVVESWSKREGCKGVLFTGRPGWKRVLAKFGYRSLGIVMTREFDGQQSER